MQCSINFQSLGTSKIKQKKNLRKQLDRETEPKKDRIQSRGLRTDQTQNPNKQLVQKKLHPLL